MVQLTVPAPDRTEAELLEALHNHNYNFSWFATEASMKVRSPRENVSASAYIRIRKDSIIWAVVKKLGVEGVRLLATPSSYATINRVDGTYSRGDTETILGNMGLGLEFYDVQEAIFGNIILPDSLNISIEKYPNSYMIKSTSGNFNLEYLIDDYALNIINVKIEDGQRSIQITYDDYRLVQDLATLPYKRSYVINDVVEGESTIDLTIKKLLLDTPKSTKFSIPPHYEKID